MVTEEIKAFFCEQLKHPFYLGSHWKNSSVEIGETLMILIPKYKDKI